MSVEDGTKELRSERSNVPLEKIELDWRLSVNSEDLSQRTRDI